MTYSIHSFSKSVIHQLFPYKYTLGGSNELQLTLLQSLFVTHLKAKAIFI